MHEYCHPDYVYAVHEDRRSRLSRRNVAGRRAAEWVELLGPGTEL